MEDTLASTKPNLNVIPLPVRKKAARSRGRARFVLLEYTNASGTRSWRVSGYKRDKSRIRENFAEMPRAKARLLELEAEYLAGQPAAVAVKATELTTEQLKLCEVAVTKLGENWLCLADAVDHWLKHGRHHGPVTESPRVDEAMTAYLAWLETAPLRPATKSGRRSRLRLFANGAPNLRVSDFSPERIESYLDSRKVSPVAKNSDRLVISSFFTWCMDRKRKWCQFNPCLPVKVDLGERQPPQILTVDQCQRLMREAEGYKDGLVVPYLAVCLFIGLRPRGEALSLRWNQINLSDGEIRLEGSQTKTGRPRVVSINNTLAIWLQAYQGRPFAPINLRNHLKHVRRLIGFGKDKAWPQDILRHTSISHFFRLSGSYGRTAEEFGNSEKIIREHYQARTSSEDTKRFYEILPLKDPK